jgi:anthraniloyl-CoA monooxygenase
MKITIIGGGPSGLYFAILMKKLDRTHEITVLERDGPNDTFGWGIVFSDQTFSYLQDNDKKSFAAITRACQRWDNVDVLHKNQKVTIRGINSPVLGAWRFLIFCTSGVSILESTYDSTQTSPTSVNYRSRSAGWC